MNDLVFNTSPTKDGFLYCPKEFLFFDAAYKVIVSLPDKIASAEDIEVAACSDNISDYLTQEEINYYLALE